MSEETNVTSLYQPKEQESHRWVKCRGCGGEIGIPTDWKDDTVECPECREQVRVNGKVLYRPAEETQAPQTPLVQVIAPSIKKTPSLKLEKAADSALTWGIVCIVLGWTIIIPLLSLYQYCEVSSKADKEQLRVPTKARVGLILTLLFGICQGFAVIAHCCK